MKKLINMGVILLSLLLLASCGAVNNVSEPDYNLGNVSDSGNYGDNVSWEFYSDSGTLVLGGKGEMADGEAESYPWYEFAGDIKAIYVKSGITTISEYCFADDYNNLERIYLPESLCTISKSAFSSAVRLKNVTIPEGVTSIGESAFYECLSLSNLTLPNSISEIEEDAFDECREFHLYYKGTEEDYAEIDKNGEFSMDDYYKHFESDGYNVEEITDTVSFVPEFEVGEITKSGKCSGDNRVDDLTWEFYEETGTLVVKGSGYMDTYNPKDNLDYDAPWGTQKKRQIRTGKITILEEQLPIKQVYIMDGVKTVGYNAFASLKLLESVKISGSVRIIYDYAFHNCDNLQEVIISKGVEEIHKNSLPGGIVIKYTGSEEDWLKVNGNEYYENREIVYNYR